MPSPSSRPARLETVADPDSMGVFRFPNTPAGQSDMARTPSGSPPAPGPISGGTQPDARHNTLKRCKRRESHQSLRDCFRAPEAEVKKEFLSPAEATFSLGVAPAPRTTLGLPFAPAERRFSPVVTTSVTMDAAAEETTVSQKATVEAPQTEASPRVRSISTASTGTSTNTTTTRTSRTETTTVRQTEQRRENIVYPPSAPSPAVQQVDLDASLRVEEVRDASSRLLAEQSHDDLNYFGDESRVDTTRPSSVLAEAPKAPSPKNEAQDVLKTTTAQSDSTSHDHDDCLLHQHPSTGITYALAAQLCPCFRRYHALRADEFRLGRHAPGLCPAHYETSASTSPLRSPGEQQFSYLVPKTPSPRHSPLPLVPAGYVSRMAERYSPRPVRPVATELPLIDRGPTPAPPEKLAPEKQFPTACSPGPSERPIAGKQSSTACATPSRNGDPYQMFAAPTSVCHHPPSSDASTTPRPVYGRPKAMGFPPRPKAVGFPPRPEMYDHYSPGHSLHPSEASYEPSVLGLHLGEPTPHDPRPDSPRPAPLSNRPAVAPDGPFTMADDHHQSQKAYKDYTRNGNVSLNVNIGGGDEIKSLAKQFAALKELFQAGAAAEAAAERPRPRQPPQPQSQIHPHHPTPPAAYQPMPHHHGYQPLGQYTPHAYQQGLPPPLTTYGFAPAWVHPPQAPRQLSQPPQVMGPHIHNHFGPPMGQGGGAPVGCDAQTVHINNGRSEGITQELDRQAAEIRGVANTVQNLINTLNASRSCVASSTGSAQSAPRAPRTPPASTRQPPSLPGTDAFVRALSGSITSAPVVAASPLSVRAVGSAAISPAFSGPIAHPPLAADPQWAGWEGPVVHPLPPVAPAQTEQVMHTTPPTAPTWVTEQHALSPGYVPAPVPPAWVTAAPPSGQPAPAPAPQSSFWTDAPAAGPPLHVTKTYTNAYHHPPAQWNAAQPSTQQPQLQPQPPQPPHPRVEKQIQVPSAVSPSPDVTQSSYYSSNSGTCQPGSIYRGSGEGKHVEFNFTPKL